MSLSEFDIIKKYFTFSQSKREDVVLGVGDDAAVVNLPNQQLVLCIDTLVAGVHFPESTQPEDIAYKAVAVNLSDLAAMGAEPAWITLALTIPTADESWLHNFSRGLQDILARYSIQLIGGDMTHGPLTVTVQAHGFVPKNQALCRAGAKVGDSIYVTHYLGNAAFALQVLKDKLQLSAADFTNVMQAFNQPEARIQIGLALREIASSCIDISDGLLADIQHILEASQVGADIYLEQIPLSPQIIHYLSKDTAQRLALTGGDDYELCFTVPDEKLTDLMELAPQFKCILTKIGTVISEQKLNLLDTQHQLIHYKKTGYLHFE